MKLGLGTVQFGLPYGISNKSGQVSAAEVNKILLLAASSGINVIDTAACYGNSESVLGANLPLVHDFSIVTKTLPLKTNKIGLEDVAKVEAGFYNSLHQLGQSSVHGLLIHHSADLLNPGGDYLYSALKRWKSEGLVKKIGVSVYDKEEVDRLFERYTFDIVQLPLNVFDQRLVQDGTLQWLYQESVEIHVRSAFLQGLLLMPTTSLPPYFMNLKSHHAAYYKVLEQAEISPLEGALGYLHNQPQISSVLIGVETSMQLQQCLLAARNIPALDFSSFAIDKSKILDPRNWR